VSEPRILLEAAVEDVDAAVAAERAGASRLELCANLHEDGTTPNRAVLRAVAERVSVPVWVMIRPRAGNFVYGDDELLECQRAIVDLATAGASGFVLGALRSDRAVDVEATARLVDRAGGLPVTFHRAFDRTPDLAVALEAVVKAGASRVLTSGGAPTAGDGAATIAELVLRSRGRAVIMAGGSIRAHNVKEIVTRTRVTEIHARFESGAQIRAMADLL
jgi:copper homeostasis protein